MTLLICVTLVTNLSLVTGVSLLMCLSLVTNVLPATSFSGDESVISDKSATGNKCHY